MMIDIVALIICNDYFLNWCAQWALNVEHFFISCKRKKSNV